MDVLIVIGVVALVAAFLLFAAGIFVTRLYRKVEQGSAMVVNKTRTIDVTFSGALVMPVIQYQGGTPVTVYPPKAAEKKAVYPFPGWK